MKQIDVYGIGNALIDIEFEVSDKDLQELNITKGVMTLIDETTHQRVLNNLSTHHQSKTKTCGGSAANTILTLQELGAQTFYSSKVAKDEYGKVFYQDLITHGVKTNIQNNLENGLTGKCIILITPDAERTMNTFLGVTHEFNAKGLALSALKNSEYLYIEGYLVAAPLGFETAVAARRLANKHQVKTAISLSDPNMVKFFKDQLLEVINDKVDILFCNEQESMMFTDTDNLKDAQIRLKKIARTFIITLGSKGALLYDGQKFIHQPAFPVKPIDTTGAGDVFAGAFLYALINGLDYVGAGLVANFAASKVILHFRSRLNEEELNEVKQACFTKSLPNIDQIVNKKSILKNTQPSDHNYLKKKESLLIRSKSNFFLKMHNPYSSVISYELIPPCKSASNKEKIAYVKCTKQLFHHSPIPIDAINIPEILDEKNLNNSDQDRPQTFVDKMDNREFTTLLRQELPPNIDYIINHCVVNESLDFQDRWITETHENYNLHNIILVGGECSTIHYPGPSVTSFATYIKTIKKDPLLLGGITIPFRHYLDPNRNEAIRLIEKSMAGIDYFTSQVIYEAESVKKLLKEYDHHCNLVSIKPKRIFLSFAPITTLKDLNFITWLGVSLNEETTDYLLSSSLGIGWRSLNVCKNLLQNILSFVEKENIKVPLGLNIEHISQHNFEISWIFIAELGALYLHYMKHHAKKIKG